ncbi:MAG TPA: bifunctional phosphopantothenoylcysteine decarboxylase/phosphopantothenate--cysteine ligase CoaBC [Polyangiaceae bacterium]|nr:bifunctional phosphopantothenoylcysteine decarboxylase/phosphopantothenate--cysteine ligase CoaBC [Polyangiaceae bacterium]
MKALVGSLAGKRIVLGVTGSIAAYKAAIVARLLVKEGASVLCVLTAGGARFVGADTFSGLTGNPVLSAMFDPSDGGERHILLAGDADLVLVVPATADALARFAAGRADDLLAATVLSARCPVLVAPAMHPSMWSHPATRRNVETLQSDGRTELVGPVEGEVASGDRGEGRMAEPEAIVARVVARLSGDPVLAGRRVIVTAGPTVEDIDAVRFLGNRSSGKMGFAIAEAARDLGAAVTLVAGPVSLETPPGVTRVDVRSALELEAALARELPGADALVMAAAVADFRPKTRAAGKLKRGDQKELALALVQNPDILAGIGRSRRGHSPFLLGFAVETGTDEEIVRYARGKLGTKRVDAVVANHAGESLGRDDNRVLIVDARGVTRVPPGPKRDVARAVVQYLGRALSGRAPSPRRSPRAKRRSRKT